MAAVPIIHQQRLSKIIGHLQANPTSAESEYIVQYRQKLRELRQELFKFIDEINCNAILVRLGMLYLCISLIIPKTCTKWNLIIITITAWHDSGTYDRTIGVEKFPLCGGANGSIRFKQELSHGANAGLAKAVNYLKPYKKKYPEISWADIIQLASVTAIEHAGGPLIPIRFGRVETKTESECPPEGTIHSIHLIQSTQNPFHHI